MATEGRVDFGRPLRDSWRIVLRAGVVAEAVKKKLDWHHERWAFWQKRRDELKAKAAEAVRMDDPEQIEKLMSELLSNSYSSSRPDLGVRLDPEWQQQFQHADRWLKKHQDFLREMAGWERLLRFIDPDAMLPLERADLVFFGIAAREPGVEE